MEHFVRSLKVFWRSERLLRHNDLRLLTQKLQFIALAALIAVFGLVMVSLSVFFALVPHWGQPLAALAVGGTDLILALGLVFYASSLKPSNEVGMVREMRDMALSDIEFEVSRAEKELSDLSKDVKRFVRNPVDALMPGALSPLLGAVVKGLRSPKKDAEKARSE